MESACLSDFPRLMQEGQAAAASALAQTPWPQCDIREWSDLLVTQSVEKCIFSSKKIGHIIGIYEAGKESQYLASEVADLSPVAPFKSSVALGKSL